MISTAAAAQRSQVTISLPLADGNWASSIGERKKAEGRRQKSGSAAGADLVSALFILPSALLSLRQRRWSLAVERGEHRVGRRVVAARAGLLDGNQGGLEIGFGKAGFFSHG